MSNLFFILLPATLLCYTLGGIVAAVCIRRPSQAVVWGYALATLASCLGVVTACLFLLYPKPWRLLLFTAVDPIGARFELLLDPLAAFFILIISLGGILTSIYAIGSSQEDLERHKNVGLLTVGYNLFFLTMFAVVLANNAYLFLVAWEGMSLVSYFLVSFEHEADHVRRAGLLYLIVTHIGTACLLGAFLLFFSATGGHLSFDAFREGASGLNVWSRNLIFLLAVIGFGAKAGLMPMHFWLPRAHPVAPSHISALMSGVMIKTALYGLVRISFDLLSGVGLQATGYPSASLAFQRVIPPLWWGTLLLSIGLISAVFGVLYALMETDLKRLLAFSSIENIGIICLGLGAALLFQALPFSFANELASLALFAAFFHLLNHTLFKSTLFLGAGAVLHATSTRNLEQLGGLLKRMPWTGLFFLIGSLAIAGLPPFNGFVSEWLTCQTLLAVVASAPDLWLKGLGTLALGGLALTGALAATTFVKAFGIGFLAQPRSEAAAKAHEVHWTMRLGMAGGAALTATVGLASGAVLTLLTPALEQWTSAGSTHLFASSPGWSLHISGTISTQASGNVFLPVLLLPLFIASLGWFIARWLGGQPRRDVDESWACGVLLKPSMAYTSIAFVKPLRRVFQLVLQPYRETTVSYLVKPYFVERIEYRSGIKSLLASEVVYALRRGIRSLITLIRVVQNGSLRLYLGYILVVLVLVLLFAR